MDCHRCPSRNAARVRECGGLNPVAADWPARLHALENSRPPASPGNWSINADADEPAARSDRYDGAVEAAPMHRLGPSAASASPVPVRTILWNHAGILAQVAAFATLVALMLLR